MAGKTDTAEARATAAFEETADRIRSLNDQIIDSAKKGGEAWLSAYEKALTSLLDFERKAAEASPIEWVSAIAKAHTDFVSEVSAAYIRVSRELVK